MKKLTLLFIGVFTLSISVFAQKNAPIGKVSGNLWDEKKQALPFANVLLLKSTDSTLVKGSVSDEKGDFVFEGIPANQYIVSVSSVGYQKYFSPKIVISEENTSVTLTTISLKLAEKSLNALTVSAKKPLIEMQADKLVMNVENSIVATGNTAMEVLQKAPGVTIDNNDNISLNGKSGILIYMDGKPTYMSQSDLANLLKNMGSDQIEKIEIISNPSARYDAAGKAIINIVTKKNKNFGTNGSISVGTSLGFAPNATISETNGVLNYKELGKFPRYNTSLNLNSRKGKFNIFGNFSFNNWQGASSNIIHREITGLVYDQYSYQQNFSNNLSYKTGLDYFVNKKTTIGILINGNSGHWENPTPTVNNGYFKTSEGTLQSSPLTTSSGYNTWASTTFNANYKHTYDSTGRELSADVDYSIYNNLSKERGLITHFFDNKGVETGTPLNITGNIPNIYNITAAKIDYSLPFIKSKAKLDFGVKSSWVKSDNDLKFYNNGTVDVGRTNHFIYTENINAIYSSFSKELSSKWSLQAGLRLEHTKSDGNSLTLNESNSREYVNLFPSIFLKEIINKKNQVAYSYSRRIERPAYDNLNPFIYFLDPYTYNLGNEYLRPQYTNSYSISHTYKDNFITTLGYSRTTDYMAQVIKNAVDDPITYAKIKASSVGTDVDPSKVSFQTNENMKLFENYSLGFSFPLTVAKWWVANSNVSVFYNRYEGTLSGSTLNFGKTAYNFYTSNIFTLQKATSLELTMWYNSPNVYGQILAKEQYAVNLGVKKSLWNKKADLKISLNDVFATNHFQGSINSGNVILTINNHWTSRSLGLYFSYKFGNSNVKSARSRSTAADDEQSRVKSGN